jgi:hypothetical protein
MALASPWIVKRVDAGWWRGPSFGHDTNLERQRRGGVERCIADWDDHRLGFGAVRRSSCRDQMAPVMAGRCPARSGLDRAAQPHGPTTPGAEGVFQTGRSASRPLLNRSNRAKASLSVSHSAKALAPNRAFATPHSVARRGANGAAQMRPMRRCCADHSHGRIARGRCPAGTAARPVDSCNAVAAAPGSSKGNAQSLSHRSLPKSTAISCPAALEVARPARLCQFRSC